jgi:hypothetical protein
MFNTLSISWRARHALEIAKRSSSGQAPGLLRPPDDVLAEPELAAPTARSPHGIGKVVVASAIRRETTGIRQANQLCDVLSVEQVVQVDEAGHDGSVVALEERSTRVVLEQRPRAGRGVDSRLRGLACHARPPKASSKGPQAWASPLNLSRRSPPTRCSES